MRQFLTLPNLVTSGNLVAGCLALMTARTSPAVAAGLVVLAVVFDALDGTIARRNAAESAFGGNLDSLADLLSFGVVPAMALWWGPFSGLPVVGDAVCVAFVVCGAWRLARFPLVKDCDCFLGLPIPVAGVLVMLVVLLPLPPWLALVAAAALAVLMLSALRFPTLAAARRGATTVAARPLRPLKSRLRRSRDRLLNRRRRSRFPSPPRARLRRARRRRLARSAHRTDVT